jgi:hypothetical protein
LQKDKICANSTLYFMYCSTFMIISQLFLKLEMLQTKFV